MKYVLFPLIALFILVVFAQLISSSGGVTAYTAYINDPAFANGWFDEEGHCVAYANGTAFGETGRLDERVMLFIENEHIWINETSPVFDLGWTVTETYDSVRSSTFEFNFFDNVGAIALIAAIVGIALVAGIQVFSSGEAEISVKTVIFGFALGGLWTVLSAGAFNLVAQIPLSLGLIFYGALTIVYMAGAIGVISGSGDA